MNDRIKEFESQCWEDVAFGPPWFNYKKFAKLVINECISAAEWVGKHNTTPVEPKHTAYAIKTRIKNQLGDTE